jgi:hypothetical protein
VIAQLARVPMHDYPVIKDIIPSILAAAIHQCVQNTALYLWQSNDN